MVTLKQWMLDNIDKTPEDFKKYIEELLTVKENKSEKVFIPRWDEWNTAIKDQYSTDLNELEESIMYDDGMTNAFYKFATSKVADQIGYLCNPKYMEMCDLNPAIVVEEFMQHLSWIYIDSSTPTVAEHDAWVESLKKE